MNLVILVSHPVTKRQQWKIADTAFNIHGLMYVTSLSVLHFT